MTGAPTHRSRSRTTSAHRLVALLLGGAALVSGCTRADTGAGSVATGRSHASSGARHTSSGRGTARISSCSVSDLPAQVPPVLSAIRAGGPFRHPRNDGVTFGNLERRLPQEQRGYYREYTVDTPGASTRGTRRVITGGSPATAPQHWYYTGDHYESFCEITDAG